MELRKVAGPGEQAGGWVNRNILDRSIGGHSLRSVTQGVNQGLWSGPSELAATPFRRGADKAKEILLGKRSTEGVHAGKRLHSLATGNAAKDIAAGNITPVSKEVADEILSGRAKGQITKGSVGGKTVYYKTKFRPKGVVGWGMKNPGKMGLAALAAYMLLKPEARQTAGSVASGFVPRGPKGPTEEFQREWAPKQQQSARPALQQQAWG